MRITAVCLSLLVVALVLQPGARAGTTDVLEDWIFNVNGTSTEGATSISGLNTGAFNFTTGEGTLTFSYSPGVAGSYFFDAWFDNELNAPFFNEYAATSGTPVAGQSWEIGDAQLYYNYSGPLPAPANTDVGDDTIGNTLSNTNGLPGNATNYNDNCLGSNCNGDVSMAMGFAFTLTAGETETVTLNLSETAPTSGFYLQQIHPVDGNTPSQLNLYFSGSAVSSTGPPPPPTPEPGTWLLVSSVVGGFALFRSRQYWRVRWKAARLGRVTGGSAILLVAIALASSQPAQAQITVKTVPAVPTNPSSPHTTYNVCSDGSVPNYTVTPPSCTSPATLTEVTITLGATAILPNTTDTYTGVWDFGDGTANYTFSVSNSSLDNYNVSTTHQYPAKAATGTTWTATLTITDNVSHVQGSGTYPVIQEQDALCDPAPLVGTPSCTVSSRVNVAIDNGLWFVHTSMWRGTTTVNSNTVNWGGWDSSAGSPGCVSSYNCTSYGAIDASHVQAFEVNGHYANGPSSDPYTDDVARGLTRMMYFLSTSAVVSKQITYNPAIMVDRCSDGSIPNYSTTPPTCTAPATLIQYNPGASSCTSPPCNFTFDENSNGQAIFEANDSGDPGYQAGMFVDALAASNYPTGTAQAGVGPSGGLPGVLGQTYLNIATDMVDGILYCQYPGDPYEGTSNGYDNGGGWSYYCFTSNYDDNSISQWNAVGLIGALRGAGFGIPTPKITTDTNQVWVTWSQDVNGPGAFSGIANGGSLTGAFGYDEWGYEPWGPFADTPSGLVQMDMDGVGRTSAGAADQRWNIAESFYHDNFCYNFSNPSNQSYYYDPLYYTYGMFSFTKAMLLYAPGGVLSPITYVLDEPSGTNPIDWYGALSPANGGTAPCDGFAQTLISRQNADGHWGGPSSYYDENGTQGYFETAWALVMLKGTIITPCIKNLAGEGTPGTGSTKPRIDLTWSAQNGASSYDIFRASSLSGTYTQVGTSTTTTFLDNNGLVAGDTYYYTVQPVNAGVEICVSNTASVTIPKGR
jgi:hypothetical protein